MLFSSQLFGCIWLKGGRPNGGATWRIQMFWFGMCIAHQKQQPAPPLGPRHPGERAIWFLPAMVHCGMAVRGVRKKTSRNPLRSQNAREGRPIGWRAWFDAVYLRALKGPSSPLATVRPKSRIQSAFSGHMASENSSVYTRTLVPLESPT